MNESKVASLARFILELGQLKRTTRSGWFKLGVDNPESVADHSFRTAAIGFILGKLEGENPYEVAGYCLFHDMAETRTLDLDWLAQNYLEKKDYLSSDVIEKQIEDLPEELKASLEELVDPDPKLKLIARDADLLELIFQALETAHQGNPMARRWFKNTLPSLKTESGKRIGQFLKTREEDGDLEELMTWWGGTQVNPDGDN